MASLSGSEEEVNITKIRGESETKRGKNSLCPKKQLLLNKMHIRVKHPEPLKILTSLLLLQ